MLPPMWPRPMKPIFWDIAGFRVEKITFAEIGGGRKRGGDEAGY